MRVCCECRLLIRATSLHREHRVAMLSSLSVSIISCGKTSLPTAIMNSDRHGRGLEAMKSLEPWLNHLNLYGGARSGEQGSLKQSPLRQVVRNPELFASGRSRGITSGRNSAERAALGFSLRNADTLWFHTLYAPVLLGLSVLMTQASGSLDHHFVHLRSARDGIATHLGLSPGAASASSI